MSIFWKALGEKYAIKIEHDSDAQNPRKDADPLGTMVCWHRRYDLGDKHDHSEPKDFLKSLAHDFADKPEGKRVLRKAQREYFKNFRFMMQPDGTWYVFNGDETYWPYRHWDTKREAVEHLKEYKQEWIDRAIDDELSFADLEAIVAPYVVILRLYLYDHSGISMSCQSFIGRAHHAEWDSGPVGYIYATKDRFRKETGYNERALFSTKPYKPQAGDMVRVKGHEDKHLAKVVEYKRGKYTVDWNYLYLEGARAPERTIKVPASDVTPVTNYAEKMLESEVETYDQYLTGDVYGYTLYSVDRDALGDHMIENDVEQDDLSWSDLDPFLTEIDSCWGFYGDDHEKNGIADNLPEEALVLLKDLEQGEIRAHTVYEYR